MAAEHDVTPRACDAARVGLLGDAPQRDYADKLNRFAAFAEPELHAVIERLAIRQGARVLDAGCGTGRLTRHLSERVCPGGWVVGLDLSGPHLRHAAATPAAVGWVQADVASPPFRAGTFDCVWACNTVNHLRDQEGGVSVLAGLLGASGVLAVAQSALLPDMYFAWDARLEEVVTRAVRACYRDRYGLTERDTTAGRNLVGLLRRAGLQDVRTETVIIERTAPLSPAAEAYLTEAVFQGYWGDQLRAYLDPMEWEELQRLTRPDSPEFCLRRADFHHLQTLTVVTGRG